MANSNINNNTNDIQPDNMPVVRGIGDDINNASKLNELLGEMENNQPSIYTVNKFKFIIFYSPLPTTPKKSCIRFPVEAYDKVDAMAAFMATNEWNPNHHVIDIVQEK